MWIGVIAVVVIWLTVLTVAAAIAVRDLTDRFNALEMRLNVLGQRGDRA